MLNKEETILKNTTNAWDVFPKWLKEYLTPPPDLSISEWADRNRILTSDDTSDEGVGKWLTARVPYLEEPMNVIKEPDVHTVVLMWGSQTGKTAGPILNTLGYHMDVDPCPILLVYPTVTQAERVSSQRISPMIRNCPTLRTKMFKKARGATTHNNSLLMKTFPGGMLLLGGADTPSSLSSFPMRVVLLDEIDRYKENVGKGEKKQGEGDPIQLAITRSSNFWNRKIILSSTPTIRNASRIEFAYEQSSQGHYHVACPVCGEYQELQWHQIDYSTFPGRVLGRCSNPSCGEYSSKAKWLGNPGHWVHSYPNRKERGFYLNTIVSPWFSWENLVAEWIKANEAKRKGNNELLKVFINTRLAQTFEDYAFRVESHALYDRREVYKAEVPEGVYVLTCGVDVQDIQKRINYEVVGWGKGYESWGIEYGTILADPRGDISVSTGKREWEEILDEMVFNRVFLFGDGHGIKVRKCLVDANGSIGPYVYHYTKRRQPRCYSSKGSASELPNQGSFTGAYKIDLKYNAQWYPINTVMGKDELFQRLLFIEPGPGYCHFPCGLDDEDVRGYNNDYFEGLTSEQKHEMINNLGYAIYKYKKEGSSRTVGEPLDCRNYARAALELVEQTKVLDKMKQPDWTIQDPKTLQNTTSNVFFQGKQAESQGNKLKKPENLSYEHEIGQIPSEIAENTPKTTKIAKSHPFFGQIGTKLNKIQDFDPFKEY